ncbi:anti-sigma regulatory factor [Deltaproteobacteria bacterium TL4]
MDESVIISVIKEQDVAQARQKAIQLSEQIGMKKPETYYIATSVSELANNLFFHTIRGGTLYLNVLKTPGKIGVEVIAEDTGPGIPNLEKAMTDGFSTNGGMGSGLPGVSRLMDEFQIFSEVGKGTKVVARKWQSCLIRN